MTTTLRVTAANAKALWAKPYVHRSVTALFLLLVVALIVQEARVIEWSEVARSIRGYEATTLATAAAFSALSYLIYSCFDLLGRHYTGVNLSARAVMSAAFVSFAANQSLGSVIGAVAFRLRIYSRLGLRATQISKIIGLSIITNWLGYAALAGIVFAGKLVSLPPNMEIGTSGADLGRGVIQVIGALLLLTAVAYCVFCAVSGGREIKIGGKKLTIPTWRLALLQLSLSALHWPAAAAIVYVLFNGQVEFATILGALLLTAIAVVLTHIPAGIGVLEAIFVALLRHRIPTPQILGALLVFRAVYNLAPLLVAAFVYARIETGAQSKRARLKGTRK